MSAPLFAEDVVFYQRLLASMGYYQDTIDGDWGPNTDAADQAFTVDSRTLRNQFGELDSRSEGNIVTLHIKAQRRVREFMKDLKDANFSRTVKVLSGTRTYAEQNRLFAKGRFGNPGPRVTNARGGFSNHNFGIAWDIGIFEGGAYYDGNTAAETAWYQSVPTVVDMTGLDWGGHWVSFKDIPHYEVQTSKTISQKRNLFEQGALSI